MAAYEFSMNKILDWRQDLEEEARQKLRTLENEKAKEEQVLQRFLKESRQLKSDSLFSSGIDTYKRHDMYKELLGDKIVNQKQRIAKIQKAIDQAQNQLVQAHKDKRVLEKLSEKEHEKFRDVQKKEEQKQLDELSTLQYGRRMLYKY